MENKKELLESNKREIGGNSLTIWYGKLLGKVATRYQKRSDKLIARGTKTLVSNPTCKFINPFTLLFNFTVDNNIKYQLVHQGDFKDQYRKWRVIVDDYKVKVDDYEKQLTEYELEEDKESVVTPVAPIPISESPLGNQEMFITILGKEKAWYKKI